MVVGWRIRKPANEAIIKMHVALDQFGAVNRPINRGLSKNTHEP
jgi:hypothetical protein